MSGILAYDLGGSSLRLAIVTRDGIIENSVRRPLQIPQKNKNQFEVDPVIWWQAFQDACELLSEQGVELASVEAIAGCGFTRTQVLIDKNGIVVHPAITFQDSRGGVALQHFLDKAPSRLGEKVSSLSPFHPIARLLWLQQTKPDIWALVDKVIEPKDYLNLQLTGMACSDPISQNALTGLFHALKDEQNTLDILAINPSICPAVQSPFSQVGEVCTGLPGSMAKLAGKPVICGSNDTWTCVLGAGGLNPGAAYGISGTSDIFGIITETQSKCDGLMSVQWGPKQWQLGGPSQGAATRLQWVAGQFFAGQSIETVIEQAFQSEQAPPVFLPYLDGERTPFWDADLRGAFIGIDSSHQPNDFIRAVADGINYLSRIILERAEVAANVTVSHICFSGGLANNGHLCQLKADILNRPVFVPEIRESGLLGAASLAFNDVNQIGSITKTIMEKAIWYYPNGDQQNQINERFEIFKIASEALEPISHKISRSAHTRNAF